MGTIFGRDAELKRIDRLLTSSLRDHLVRAVRLTGASGVGKSALAGAAAERARDGQWLVAETSCYRIHAALPIFVARRLARSLVEQLGERAEPYISGLQLEQPKPELFEEAFYRLLEAVTLDFPVLLLIDDTQWADDESRAFLRRALAGLADRRIVLITTERSDEPGIASFDLGDETIVLGELPRPAAEQLVRSVFPAANDDVVESIVGSASARAVDLVSVTEAARDAHASNAKGVSASTRAVIAREISQLDPEIRSFLQICALIEEPIDFSLLRQMWEQDELLRIIDGISGRYIVEDGGELHFVHAAVMEAIHETIPIEIPYRYRIIEALEKLSTPRLEDYERLAQQAAACRDVARERAALMKLAMTASAQSLQTLAADAMERALRVANPSAQEIVPIFTQLCQHYQALGRESDAIRAARTGLGLAREAGLADGTGVLVSQLILALWNAGQYQNARAEYDRYRALFSSPSDLAQMLSVGTYIAMQAGNFEEVGRNARDFSEIAEVAHPLIHLRQYIAEGFTAMRLGQEARALDLVGKAEVVASQLPPVVMTMPRALRILHATHYLGAPAAQRLVSARQNELGETLSEIVLAVSTLGCGQLTDVSEFVSERLMRGRDRTARRALLTAYAVAATFDPALTEHPLWSSVRSEIAEFYAGDRANALLVLMSAWLGAAQTERGEDVVRLLDELIAAHARPFDNLVFSFPFVLVRSAKRLEATDRLKRLSSENALWADATPWNRGQALLARGSALIELRSADGVPLLKEARDIFNRLGLTFFSQYTSSLLEAKPQAPVGALAPNKTTRREREVAALVADGLTNKEIAQRLVLSERTVEGHIANLFGKVNVGSRTQLAAWYLRSASSVAS